MIKTLKKVGNSNAVILDKALMDLVGLEKGGKVQLTVNGQSIVITPAEYSAAGEREFESALAKVAKKRRKVLARLAK